MIFEGFFFLSEKMTSIGLPGLGRGRGFLKVKFEVKYDDHVKHSSNHITQNRMSISNYSSNHLTQNANPSSFIRPYT